MSFLSEPEFLFKDIFKREIGKRKLWQPLHHSNHIYCGGQAGPHFGLYQPVKGMRPRRLMINQSDCRGAAGNICAKSSKTRWMQQKEKN